MECDGLERRTGDLSAGSNSRTDSRRTAVCVLVAMLGGVADGSDGEGGTGQTVMLQSNDGQKRWSRSVKVDMIAVRSRCARLPSGGGCG